ncbi:metallothionein 2 [Gigaspora rosea]|uniref:Metallothionein 2 n=1 Tax=Gigaspora rosea TaxID=44941 RepID=A0A397UQZ3_9GLOM|nr:metallothionein 2 [Gigaspora rosea]
MCDDCKCGSSCQCTNCACVKTTKQNFVDKQIETDPSCGVSTCNCGENCSCTQGACKC